MPSFHPEATADHFPDKCARTPSIGPAVRSRIEITLNTLGLIPGFNLARDLYLIMTGQRITGDSASGLDKLPAIDDNRKNSPPPN